MKILVLIDLQKDFIDGSLGTPEAQVIIPKIVEYINNIQEKTLIFFTQDTHEDFVYLNSQEGRKLPVKHCIFYEEGCLINQKILEAIYDNKNCIIPRPPREMISEWQTYNIYKKSTFGSIKLANKLSRIKNVSEIKFMGLCTDICVVSNVLLVKAYCPEVELIVDASCCAGTTPERHKAALEVMKSCQVEIVNMEGN